MKKIRIVSGKIRTGKSTRLLNWSKRQHSVGGVIQMLEGNKRFVYDLATGSKRKLELDSAALENAVRVGFYCFDKNVFDWAQKVIISAASNYDIVIIDELGKLELKNQGLEPAVSELFRKKHQYDCEVILVIRDFLLKEVLEKYELDTEDFEHFEVPEFE